MARLRALRRLCFSRISSQPNATALQMRRARALDPETLLELIRELSSRSHGMGGLGGEFGGGLQGCVVGEGAFRMRDGGCQTLGAACMPRACRALRVRRPASAAAFQLPLVKSVWSRSVLLL